MSEGGGRRAAEQAIECVSARQKLYVSVRVSSAIDSELAWMEKKDGEKRK